MTKEQVLAFQVAVGTAQWSLSFNQFCERTGFVSEYAVEKWKKFQQLHKALGDFDTETLAKILGG